MSTPGPAIAGDALVVRLDFGVLNGLPGRLAADYLSDGTVIRWTDAGTGCQTPQPCQAMERNTLTAAGLAAVRALLAEDADLLGRPRTFEPRLLAGTQPSGRSTITDSFVMEGSDGNRYTVNAPSRASFDAPSWAPDPAIERLNALAATLADPATLVGASGLADPTWTPYTPEKTAVFIRFVGVAPVATPTPKSSGLPNIGMLDGPFPYPDISRIGWPFAGTPDTFGSTFTPDPSAASLAGGGSAFRCAFLPTADAVTGIGRFLGPIGARSAAGDLASGVDWTGGTMRWSAKSPTAGLSLAATAILPEDAGSSCADLQPR